MQNVKVTLSIVWIAVMLTYLWGDVLRIIVGDNIPGEIGKLKFTQGTALIAAALMVIPILMVVLSLVLPHNLLMGAMSPLGYPFHKFLPAQLVPVQSLCGQ